VAINLAGKIQQQLQPRKSSGEAYRLSSGATARVVSAATGKVLTQAPALDKLTVRSAAERMAAGTAPVYVGAPPRAESPAIAVATARPQAVSSMAAGIERLMRDASTGSAAKGPRHGRVMAKRRPSTSLGEVAAANRDKKRAALAKAPGKKGGRVAFVGGVHPVDIANGFTTGARGLYRVHTRPLPKGTPASVRQAPVEVAFEEPQLPAPSIVQTVSTKVAEQFTMQGAARPAFETDPIPTEEPSIVVADAKDNGIQRMALLAGVVLVAWFMFKRGGGA